MASLTSIARRLRVHRTTLSRRLKVSNAPPIPVQTRVLIHPPVVVLDGTTISKQTVLVVAYDTISGQPLAWSFVSHERFDIWHPLLVRISSHHQPHAIVSDGQKGLLKASKSVFPHTPHQRCIAHIIRLSLAWLTRNPQTFAGQELRVLVRNLAQTKTSPDANRWRDSFLAWDVRYESFLKEKSLNPVTGRKWHTHRKLRAVRSLILHALPNMFLFTSDPYIPNTTNAVEGGINAPLAELLHRHRGITEQQKKALVTRFLYARRKRKLPTRNAT
ncbi:MAG: transposase [Candidatus Woesearchaeota archaeon]|nr:transposase [Candidatus Woesearchaeota archaeon]